MSAAVEVHWASLWEAVGEVVQHRPAVSNGGVTRTWAEYEDRAARLATGLAAHGLGPRSKVGLYMYNSNEYLESQYGALKARCTPINVNYRYVDDELVYLLDNADAEALVFHTSMAERLERIAPRLPRLRLLIGADPPGADTGEQLGDVAGAHRYEEVLEAHDPMSPVERPADDLYMLYTGGTTGMPKGVMYAIGDIAQFFSKRGFEAVGERLPESVEGVVELVRRLDAADHLATSVTAAPLMHGTGLWLGASMHHSTGGHVVTLTSSSFDPHELLDVIERRRCTHATIVGDAFSKPILAAIDAGAPDGHAYDLSSLRTIISSGVMWTNEVKQALTDRIPQLSLLDAMGSSEGSIGSRLSRRGQASDTARFRPNPDTKVFDEHDREVTPGSGQIGMVAGSGLVALGYYKDPEKSARTFRTIDGVRYVFPGDMAQVDVDGSLILLGRGSNVINTGGEKVFPEEVEEAVKRVEGVVDCLVVGVDDERFGQAVTAVASIGPGASVTEPEVIAAVKRSLAGYKAPKRVVFVDTIPRAPNGKADYVSARRMASG
jgi:acyl-CoA synthetase (AMP-forming)/AMP-acid ligase II